jgi:hypothetical protein
MTQAAILEGLANSKLAAEMTDEQRKALAAAMTLRELAPGEVLVREGDTDDHLYVIASGVLGIIKAAGTENENGAVEPRHHLRQRRGRPTQQLLQLRHGSDGVGEEAHIQSAMAPAARIMAA